MEKTLSFWDRKNRSILDAASDLFSQHGFDRVNMDDIAKQAKVSKATVYRHFENKEKLYVSVIKHLCHALNDGKAPEEPRDAIGALVMICTEMLKRFYNPELQSLMQTVCSGSRHIPVVGDIYWASGPGIGFNTIKQILAGLKESHPEITVGAESGAWMLFGAIAGQPVMQTVCSKNELIDHAMIRDRAKSVVKVFLRGVGLAFPHIVGPPKEASDT